MASTSPYQGNDYNAALSLRPYRLPINDIFKALSAQNEYWNQGAERVKNVYDNALGLQLSNEQNQQIRDQYMKDSEKQLTKLSSMDLSDPSVQRQGFSIFKPLMSDEGIISDDAATRHIRQTNAEALSYRNKDGGKYYNQANHQYALLGANEFLNSQDRFAGKAYLQNAKSYEPYYDYTAEYDKILKNCNPDVGETDSVLEGTGYINHSKIKQLSQAKVSNCLEAGISDKGYRQMQIEGTMAYHNNPQTLASDYGSFLSSSSANLSDQIQTLSGQLSGIADNKKLSAQDKQAASQQLNQQISGLQDQLLNQNHIVDKLSKGDYSPIAGNEEQIAGSLYQYRKVLKKSYAAAYQEISNQYKPDAVQMQQIGYGQKVALENLGFQHDAQLKNLEYNYQAGIEQMKEGFQQNLEMTKLMMSGSKGASGKGESPLIWDAKSLSLVVNPLMQPVSSVYSTKPETVNEFGNITSQLDQLNGENQKNTDYLFNSFVAKGENDKGFRDRLTKAFGLDNWQQFKANGNVYNSGGTKVQMQDTQWFKNYVKQNPDDPHIQTWNVMNAQIQGGMKALNVQLEQGEQQVAQRLGLNIKAGETAADAVKRATREKINDLKPVSVNGVTVTPQDIQDLMEGLPSKKGLVVQDNYEQGVFTSPGSSTGGHTTHTILINGKPTNSLDKLYNQVIDRGDELNTKLKKTREAVYANSQFAEQPWFFHSDDESQAAQTFQSKFPASDKIDGKKRGVQIEQMDFQGGFKVRVPGLTPKEFEEAQKLGYGPGNIEHDPNGDKDLLVVKGTNYFSLPSASMDQGSKNTAYVLSMIAKGPKFQQAGPGQKVQDSDMEFPIMDRSGNQQKIKVQIYKGLDGNPLYEIYDTDGVMRAQKTDAFSVMKYIQGVTNTTVNGR